MYFKEILKIKMYIYTFDVWQTKQVRLRLDDADTGNVLQIVPETYSMDVPSACTIVIIAGLAVRLITIPIPLSFTWAYLT